MSPNGNPKARAALGFPLVLIFEGVRWGQARMCYISLFYFEEMNIKNKMLPESHNLKKVIDFSIISILNLL